MITVADVKDALTAATATRSEHVDARVGRTLGARYIEHGRPCCLVAEVMTRVGISIGVLRQLDREAAGASIALKRTRHPIQGRFESVAWQLLCAVQHSQDRGRPWGQVVDDLLRPQASSWERNPPLYPWNEGTA